MTFSGHICLNHRQTERGEPYTYAHILYAITQIYISVITLKQEHEYLLKNTD